ncbi:MAG: radical SAM protein, partial [candidate division KSB1 bacterium]|nr:radical SAM protein [candidate division KSB1 bacterium]
MLQSERWFELYRDCRLCPRQCGVDRTAGRLGVCGESADLRIAAIEAHFGEEPPISGTHGSGTVFFTGCTLRCTFCQNYQISCEHLGEVLSVSQTADRLQALSRRGVHNVNFVTPDHFLPHTLAVVDELRRRGVEIPILYNTSGYCRIDSLRLLDGIADMYLPDYKYSDPELARRLSHASDYPDVALAALQEMVRQVGFLDAFVE